MVAGNLWKVRKIWARLSMILLREGANPRVSGVFFKAVVQEVLIFGSETCIMNPRMGRGPGGVKHRVSRQITGRHLW